MLLGFLIAFATVFPSALSAQQRPTIQYILPDVCAPNMSAYIEIIAAPGDTASFGRDGLYPNNPGDAVRVELERPADSSKVIIGPVVVSWNGRLISTQVFVLPTVQPDASDWNKLDAAFRIPIRVVVSGRTDSVSTPDTLYLVSPYIDVSKFTRQSPNNQNIIIIGEQLDLNNLPKSVRSRRGALIVGNINLEGRGVNGIRRYIVSTLDCDPSTEGNQGFLPFVMLSTGKIDGGGAILSANATDKNGGAGGGGGGGQVCDASSPNSGDGGNGFTGGAAGGNNALIGGSQWYNGGSGSGRTLFPALLDPNVFPSLGGSGLNGVAGATSRMQINGRPESSGGGTGHPFGISGKGWDGDANDQKPAETAGGGIGRRQRTEGDGGGYGTTGFSAVVNGYGGGQRHGNEAVVPIAGGSGGASGNPQGAIVCGGIGGGGGGAIRIAAPDVQNLTLEARGAAGSDGSGLPFGGSKPAGGAGSGGHISVHSRLDAVNVLVNVQGGSTQDQYFGAGRMRFDTPNRIKQVTPLEKGIIDPLGSVDTLFRSYAGITLTPLTNVVSPYTIKTALLGFAGFSSGIRFFRRTLRGRWEDMSDSIDLTIGGSDTRNVPLSYDAIFTPIVQQPRQPQDSLLFVVAVQRFFESRPPAPFETNPGWVIFQTGTHILRIVPLPFIETSIPSGSELAFPQVERCGVEMRSSTTAIIITNKRGGVLHIDSIRTNSSYFTIALPRPYAFTLQQDQSVTIPLLFTATSAIPADRPSEQATLEIFHNDIIPDVGNITRANPQSISLRAPIKTIQFSIKPTIAAANNDASIDFGNVALGDSVERVVTFSNLSRDAVRFAVSAARAIASTPFRFAERTFESDSTQIRISFKPDVPGNATTQTVIVRVSGIGRCSTDTISYRLTLRGVGTRPQLDIPNTDSIATFSVIAPVCFPDIARSSALVQVASAGNDVLTVKAVMASTASFFVLSPSDFTLEPVRMRRIEVRFTAPPSTQATTTYRDTLRLITNDPRPEAKERRIPIAITVQSNFAHVNLAPSDTVRFGAVQFFNAVTRSVRITNSGNTPFTVNIGSLRAPYRIVRPTQSAFTLAPGAVDSVVVEMLPSDAQAADELVRDTLRLSYTNVAAPCLLAPSSIAIVGTPSGQIAMQARIWLDTLRDVNMLRDTSIRLFGQVIGTAINRADTLRAAFKIRRGMFFPRAEALTSPFGKATLDSNRADSLDRFVVIRIPNVRLLPSTTLIATIGGTPIMTDTMRSVFEWIPAQTRWSRGDSVYAVSRNNYGNGLMVMNVVLQQIGNALVPRLPNNAVQRRTTTIVSMYPTPAHDELTITAKMAEEGIHSVQIVNMLGERMLMRDWKPEAQTDMLSTRTYTLTLPVSSLPSGVYGVIVITPSGKRASALMTIEK